MSEPYWLSRAAIEAIHEESLAEHGGAPGIRDAGLLDAALARPRHKYAYGETGILRLAAAYVWGLVRNHAFVDGNKRIGFLAGYVFLALNGYDLDAPEPEVVLIIGGVAGGEISEDELFLWLSTHARPVA